MPGPISRTVLLQNRASGPSLDTYFYFRWSNNVTDVQDWRVACDSSGNIFAAGPTNQFGQGGDDSAIVKLGPDGVLIWDKVIGWGSGNEEIKGIAIDGSDNVYLVMSSTNNTGSQGGRDGILLKYNNDGVLQWVRGIGSTGTEEAQSVTIDSNDDVIIAGGTGNIYFLAKYSGAGVLQWQRDFGYNDFDVGPPFVGVDSSNNIYVHVSDFKSSGVDAEVQIMMKWNSSGVLQASREYRELFETYLVDWGGAVKPNGENCFVGEYRGTQAVAKQNTNLTPRLAYRTRPSGVRLECCKYDSQGNLYIMGKVDGNNGRVWLVKLADTVTLDTVTWAKEIVFQYQLNERVGDIAIDPNDNVILSVWFRQQDRSIAEQIILKIPGDGNINGNYAGLDIEDSTATSFGNFAASNAVSGITEGAAGLTSYTPNNPTEVDPAATTATVSIP